MASAVSNMLKPFSNFFRMGAVWLAGRGATATALLVATAVFGATSPAAIPFIVLPIAYVATSLNTQLMHRHREERLLQTYRGEIGASLGMDVGKVTTEHLHLVADGSDSLGIKPNKILKEAIDNDETNRANSLISSGISILLSIGLVVSALSGNLAGVIENFVGNGDNFLGIKNTILAASVASGATNFVMNQSISGLGEHFLGLNQPTINDKVRDLMRQQKRGVEILPEQVMEIYADVRPELSEAVNNHYNLSFSHLPPNEQRQLVELYDSKLGITKMTQLINEGRVQASELAFAAQGESSGVEVKTKAEVTMEKSKKQSKPKEASSSLGAEDGKVMEIYLQPVAESYAVPERKNAISQIIDSAKNKADEAQSFVERYTNDKSESVKQKIVDDAVDEVVTDDVKDSKSFVKDLSQTVIPEVLGIR